MIKGRKNKNREIELGGQDSFLDLVSNIVGILIILVMVAGIRAQYSSANIPETPQQAAAPEMLADINAQKQELQKKEAATTTLRQNVEKVQAQSRDVAEQIQRQTAEYAVLFDLMTSVRAAIEVVAEEKSQTDKEKIEFQRQLLETNAKLEQIDKAKMYFQQVRPQATVLENIPTPLAQTVEDKEIHVRLLGGKIAYVPFTELFMRLRGHVGENQHQIMKQQSTAGKVGPIDNFELEYLLRTYNVPVSGGIETRMELQYAEFVPALDSLGEPLRYTLASPQSKFRRKLAQFRKDIYTVTVWVYPDSFEEYQELKKFLQEQGYAVAARPSAMGHPISASPYGTKSSAQ